MNDLSINLRCIMGISMRLQDGRMSGVSVRCEKCNSARYRASLIQGDGTYIGIHDIYRCLLMVLNIRACENKYGGCDFS